MNKIICFIRNIKKKICTLDYGCSLTTLGTSNRLPYIHQVEKGGKFTLTEHL